VGYALMAESTVRHEIEEVFLSGSARVQPAFPVLIDFV
jgi:hypothetical protein